MNAGSPQLIPIGRCLPAGFVPPLCNPHEDALIFEDLEEALEWLYLQYNAQVCGQPGCQKNGITIRTHGCQHLAIKCFRRTDHLPEKPAKSPATKADKTLEPNTVCCALHLSGPPQRYRTYQMPAACCRELARSKITLMPMLKGCRSRCVQPARLLPPQARAKTLCIPWVPWSKFQVHNTGQGLYCCRM